MKTIFTKISSAHRLRRLRAIGGDWRTHYNTHKDEGRAIEKFNNSIFKRYNETLLWFEDPASCGLRFIGYADECTHRVGHTGWYLDSFQDSTVRGAVWQLPGRKGVTLLAYGVVCTDNPSGACISLDLQRLTSGENYYDTRDLVSGVVHLADRLAKVWAEEAREDDALYQAEQITEEKYQELRDLRTEIVSLCREMRSLRTLDLFNAKAPVSASILEGRIRDALQERNEAWGRIKELADNPRASFEAF